MCKPPKDNPETSRAAGSHPCSPVEVHAWSLTFYFWGHDVILVLRYTILKLTDLSFSKTALSSLSSTGICR